MISSWSHKWSASYYSQSWFFPPRVWANKCGMRFSRRQPKASTPSRLMSTSFKVHGISHEHSSSSCPTLSMELFISTASQSTISDFPRFRHTTSWSTIQRDQKWFSMRIQNELSDRNGLFTQHTAGQTWSLSLKARHCAHISKIATISCRVTSVMSAFIQSCWRGKRMVYFSSKQHNLI